MTNSTETVVIHPLIQKLQDDFNRCANCGHAPHVDENNSSLRCACGCLNYRGKGPTLAEGAFGDMDDCTAVVETVYVSPVGINEPSWVSYFGCNYTLKGFPEKEVVEGFGLPKAMVSALPREVIYPSWVLKLSLLWMFFFQRKKFIKLGSSYFGLIYRHSLGRMNPARYSNPVKELRRAFYFALSQEVYRNGLQPIKILDRSDFGLLKNRDYFNLASDLIEFVCTLIELDSAYRFRLQDVLEELSKDNVKKSVYKEFKRLFNLELSREVVSYDGFDSTKEAPGTVRTKMKIIGWMFGVVLFFMPFARRVLKDFLLNLDIDKIKLDEDDWYFCLKRKQYNFKGVPLKDRLELKEKIDKEKGHIMLKIVHSPQGLQIGLPKEEMDKLLK